MNSQFEAVIGLEVHAQLLTKSKAFCSCSTAFGAQPNTQVCPVCLGLPGALPVLNAEAVRMAVSAALAVNCSIQKNSRFARKNYFYPDLPKGYQISQFDEPFSQNGHLDIEVQSVPVGSPRRHVRARIQRVHMEEDAGKNLHDRGDDSIVDLNRSGTALIEIVGEPDLRSGLEAAEYLRTLREILVFIGVNDGNLEEGSFRCDANVSIRPIGASKFGTRTELKNINSFRFVQKAIDYEIARQESVIKSGGTIVMETRGWDEKSGETFSMRSKEEAHDYRYFPEPDLPALVLEDAYISQIRDALPELPQAKRERFANDLKLPANAAQVLTQHPAIASLFERAAELHGDALRVANFVQGEVLRDTTTRGLHAEIPLTSEQIADLLKLVDAGTISGKQAKEVYAKLRGTDARADEIVRSSGMAQVSDAGLIDDVVRRVLEANPKQAEAVKNGKTGVIGFLVGQVMKEMKGSANPAMVNEALQRLLGL